MNRPWGSAGCVLATVYYLGSADRECLAEIIVNAEHEDLPVVAEGSGRKARGHYLTIQPQGQRHSPAAWQSLGSTMPNCVGWHCWANRRTPGYALTLSRKRCNCPNARLGSSATTSVIPVARRLSPSLRGVRARGPPEERLPTFQYRRRHCWRLTMPRCRQALTRRFRPYQGRRGKMPDILLVGRWQGQMSMALEKCCRDLGHHGLTLVWRGQRLFHRKAGMGKLCI